jgi:ABC-type transporter Mla subunit MlaD
MADSGRNDPFSDIISLVAGPIAAVIKSFDQLRRGADELMKGLENFNRTMSNLNDTAERVNSLLADVEEPVRAILPQVVKTVRFADEFTSKMSGPMEQVVPGLVKLSETLNSPVISSLPTDLSGFVDSINDLVRRLSPLGQLAESAGGLFGLRIPGLSRGPSPEAPPPSPPASRADDSLKPVKKSPAKKAAAKKSAAKK